MSRVLYFRHHAILHGELPGMSVGGGAGGTVPTCGPGGYIFLEGGIKAPGRLSHPDGVPRGQGEAPLPALAPSLIIHFKFCSVLK